METEVKFTNDIVDTKSNLPIPHLSFIIKFLLPKRLIGFERSRLQQQYFKEVIANDHNMADGFFKPVLVGSVAEGYNIPDVILRSNTFQLQTNCDADILLVVPQLLISDNTMTTTDEQEKLRLDTNDTHPGYAHIAMTQPKEKDDTFIFVEESNKYFMSGTKIQEKLMSAVGLYDMTSHGPAISSSGKLVQTLKPPWIHPLDYVIALPCKSWPGISQPWIDREMKGEWLDKATIDNIVESGVHLVAVPHKLSPLPELEWRISFAVSEAVLAERVITDEQRQCYVFLKIIYHETLKKLELLTSYHLKTIFLHSCERLPTNAWVENPGGCLLFMIDLLAECMQKKNLPNFFIPKNNLIDYLKDEQILEIKTILESVREMPLKPILEFTDTKIMGLQSLSTPFREIASPILEDMVDFLGHRDVQRSVMNAFLSALFKMVYVLVLERKPEEAVKYILDVFPTINKYGGGAVNVAQLVDSIAMNFVSDIQLTTQFLEEAIKCSEEHPDVLQLRGNLACMFHALANKYPDDSEEHTLAMVQAETLFNTVVDVENIYSPTAVDFCCLLIKQGRFDEASEKLDRFITEELKHPKSVHCFYKKEVKVLDETLQKEVNLRGQLAVNSLSMAYYLLLTCVVKDDLSSADPTVYKKIMDYFKNHCHQINTSESFSLLGYSYIKILDWDGAKEAFQKALETCDGSVRLIKENLAYCAKKLESTT